MFGAENLTPEEIRGKKVIEVGSYYVNGSLRPIIESWEPFEYTGVDIKKGSGTDIICNAENLLEKFAKESFDIVISSELIEHTRNWRRVISNIKSICKPNGIILITTRSRGFGYHAAPNDFWRYELKDMKNIFSDCEILVIQEDIQVPGVFIKVRKPVRFNENDLSNYKLYDIVVNKKVSKINDDVYRKFANLSLVLKRKLETLFMKVFKLIFPDSPYTY